MVTHNVSTKCCLVSTVFMKHSGMLPQPMIHRRRSVGKTRTRHGQTTRRHAERTLHTYTHDERAGAREGQDAVHIHTRRKVRERERERERGGGGGGEQAGNDR
jgi:hypothetical protein